MSTPTEQTRITPRGLFRTFATAEMITWAGLITALILRAVDVGNFVPIAGGVHGFVFLSYSVTTIFVWVNQKWRPAVGITGLLLAIVPFATVPFDIAIDRRGLLAGGWRLARGGDEPRGFIEHVQAWVLRHLLVAIIGVVVLVAAVFVFLLWLGPPPIPRG
ncbi:membrane protein [Microbacterium faecale]|uniref:Membrane protein n=1 Tax=Microbacterium faecale TaxID=1804630 RepID=A0A916Y061_9MICO|nr:DUF3817 domain-containing protein [Microbacterium faecale]GGD24325.1 membrane protein [Microbacterium faecale]